MFFFVTFARFSPKHKRAMSTIELTQGKIFPHIIRFTVPVMLGNILQQTYSLIDAAIVGKMLGINALSAVGASASIIFLILGFCQGCCCGFSIPVAQKFGAADMPAVRKSMRTGVLLSLYMSIAITIATSIFCGDILRVMKTPENIFEDSYIYLLITFISIPLTFFYNLYSYIIRALGDSKTPFYFLIVATVINVVLDIFFIGSLKMGVAGAAFATMIAQGVSAVLCHIFIRRRFKELQATGEEKKFDRKLAKILIWLGVPIGLQFSITAIGCIILQAANNVLGPACVAAFAAASRIKMFFFCPLESLGITMTAFSGQNYGAMKPVRIWKGIQATLVITMIYSVAAFVCLYFGAEWISTLFMPADEAETIRYTAKFLIITAAFFPLLGSLLVFRNSIQGCGYTGFAMWAGVFEMVARSLTGLLLVPVMGFTAVCLGDPIAWVAANIFLVPAFIYVYKRIRK